MNKNDNNYVRIVIDVPKSIYQRGKRYFKRDRYKNYFAIDAFEKRVNFLEGRDKKLRTENLKKDAEYIQEMIDNKLIKIQSDNGHIPTANNFRR